MNTIVRKRWAIKNKCFARTNAPLTHLYLLDSINLERLVYNLTSPNREGLHYPPHWGVLNSFVGLSAGNFRIICFYFVINFIFHIYDIYIKTMAALLCEKYIYIVLY